MKKLLQVCTSALLLASLATACSSRAARIPDPTGFLKDYSKLGPSAKIEGARSYVNKKKPLRMYKTVIIEPAKVYVSGSEIKEKQINAQDLTDLALYLDNWFGNALGDKYPIAEVASHDTFRLRVAITSVTPSLMGGTEKDSTMGMSVGGAAIEVELLDALSGEQIAAFADSRLGASRGLDLQKGKYDDAKLQIRNWARKLTDALDESQGLHSDATFRASGEIFRDDLPNRDD